MALSYRDRCRARVTVVSDEFIDEHMAKASGEYVKVYLYLLRHEGEDVTAEDIARRFSQVGEAPAEKGERESHD